MFSKVEVPFDDPFYYMPKGAENSPYKSQGHSSPAPPNHGRKIEKSVNPNKLVGFHVNDGAISVVKTNSWNTFEKNYFFTGGSVNSR
jgi:hypothetical protein